MITLVKHPWLIVAIIMSCAGILGCCIGYALCDFNGMFEEEDGDRLHYPHAYDAQARTAAIRRTWVYDEEAE